MNKRTQIWFSSVISILVAIAVFYNSFVVNQKAF